MKTKIIHIKKLTAIFFVGILLIIYIDKVNSHQESINEKYTLSNRFNEINKINSINEIITKNKFKWKANYTSVIDNQTGDINIILGCIEEENNYRNYVNYNGFIPQSFNWRNVNGTDWTTSIKNQGGCGSCTAFATVGAIESIVQIDLGKPFSCDLSEAHLFFCSGGKCNIGLSISNAANYAKNYGISDESCFNYNSYDMECNQKSSNWRSRVVKIKNTGKIYSDIDSIKKALLKHGPLVTSMKVYTDFYYYESGIYEHVFGNFEGYHAVIIVGYNDEAEYWICKNSWGTQWGEEGWFNIKYGNSNIGKNTQYFSGIDGNIQPFIPTYSYPKKGETNVNTKIKLAWNCEDPNGDKIFYDVYLSKGYNIDETDLIVENISEKYYNITNLSKNTSYTWKIVARDEHGSQQIGQEYTFITAPPKKPNLDGPKLIRINKEYEYTSYGGDTDGNTYYWFFDWDDGTNSGWIGPFKPEMTFNMTHIWTNKGSYNIKVRYKEDGIISPWSDSLSIVLSKSTRYHILQNFFSRLFNDLYFKI